MNKELERYLNGVNAPEKVRVWVEKNYNEYHKLSNVEHIIDYLCSDKAPKRLDRATYKDMLMKAEKWSISLQKNGKDYIETKKDIETVLDFKDGFKIVKLLSKRAFNREGKLMRHCVESYFSSNDEIYSLRDKTNKPHATMSKNSEQIKGKGNGSINPKYVKYVVEFLEFLNINVRDSEMKLLGYYNIEKIKDKLHKDTPLFRDKYLFETEKFIGKDGEELYDLDLWDIKPLISESKINYDLNSFIPNLKFKDSSQLASNGNYSQLVSSGDSSKLASSGYSSKLASSGNFSKLVSSGDFSKLVSSGNSSKLASSGYSSKLASSGDYSKLELKGKHSVGTNIGLNGHIKGIKGTWITLAEYEDNICICVKSAQIDGIKLKENVWYTLENKKFVEVENA